MDMQVNSKTLEEQKQRLAVSARLMLSAANAMKNFNRGLNSELEGQQYFVSERVTETTCSAIEQGADNMQNLSDWLSDLAECVREYDACRY